MRRLDIIWQRSSDERSSLPLEWNEFSEWGRVEGAGIAPAAASDDGAPGGKVARWQNLIPSFPWIAPGWRAWGRNPRKGRDQILQCSVAEP